MNSTLIGLRASIYIGSYTGNRKLQIKAYFDTKTPKNSNHTPNKLGFWSPECIWSMIRIYLGRTPNKLGFFVLRDSSLFGAQSEFIWGFRVSHVRRQLCIAFSESSVDS